MKKTILVVFLVIAMLSITACNSDKPQEGAAVVPSSTTESKPTTVESKPEPHKQLTPEKQSKAEEQPVTDDELYMDGASVTPDDVEFEVINGTILAVYADGTIAEQDFGYEEYDLTPIKIADALSAWTGLNFDIDYEVINDNNDLAIYWLWSSSLATGDPGEMENEAFQFFDADTLKWFMLNSLCNSLLTNYGDVNIYYDSTDVDLVEIGLGDVINPAIAYNRSDNANVIIR